MLLPYGAIIKFKMVPAFDKSSICSIAAFFGCMIISGRNLRYWNGFGLAELLISTMIISPFITAQLNSDQIIIGSTILPALNSYDGGSAVIEEIIKLIPFFIGRQFLSGRSDTEEILRVLVVAGLIYSFPAMFEVRFSPQLHIWIYGYFPWDNAFDQQMRADGFRPVVFMGHGLLVSFFFCTTAVAAAAFWRTNTRAIRKLGLPSGWIAAYLCVILALCKSLGSTIYAAIVVPLVYLTKPKMQIRFAVFLTSAALLYPVLRASDLVPTNTILELASSVSSERGESLETRLLNEEALLRRASERLWFGWGGFGRSRIYDEAGRNLSITDGIWIITLGVFGIVGFVAQFGLLALPIYTSARAIRYANSGKDQIFLCALTLILAINILDLIPNSSIRPWTWLIAGALLGHAEALRRGARLSKSLPMKSTDFGPIRARVRG